MVFQDYALFPHLTVADNIAFGLRGESAGVRQARVGELLSLVGLSSQGKKYPHEMSGGQQQRVALARALAPRPSLLLLDEPFSNLDVDLRERLSYEVRDIIKATDTTAILVTHDQHEAFAVADEIGIMHEGRIQQWDTPYNLYHEPTNRFVADFIGQGVSSSKATCWTSAGCRSSLACSTAPGPCSAVRAARVAGSTARKWTCGCVPTTSCMTTAAR